MHTMENKKRVNRSKSYIQLKKLKGEKCKRLLLKKKTEMNEMNEF